MQIDAIDVYHLALPLVRPQRTDLGEFDKLETVLVRIQSGGSAGWGEATPGSAPLAASEWAEGVFGCVRRWLAPAIAGRWIDSGNALQGRLAPFQGNRFAKAALDIAWWDLKARSQNLPLYKLFDSQRESLEVGASFDRMDTIDELLESIRRAFDAGYSRAELKLRPGWDVHMLNAVRQEFPVETFHTDIEGTMRLDHMELLCRMDDFSMAMVEQPLAADDLVGHAMVQEAVRTPVCLDEAVTTPEQADMALELHSCRYMNIRPGRVGGITPAIAIHDACRDAGVPCRAGATPQTAIGTRAVLALATKSNFDYPADYFPSQETLRQDVFDPLAAAKDADDGKLRVRLWSEPGLGVEPDLELLGSLALNHARIEAGKP